jgi:hypothetical protein
MLVLSCVVAAQQPLCTDPVRPPGACFVPKEPGYWYLWIPGPDGLVVVGPLDQKNFEIVRPNATTRSLVVDNSATVSYCTPLMLIDGTCPIPNPPPDFSKLYVGMGRVTANFTMYDPVAPPDTRCPTAVHVKAEVRKGDGDPFTLRADVVLVKDKSEPSGCRVVVNEVTLKAK